MCKAILLFVAFTSELMHCQASSGHAHTPVVAAVVAKNYVVAWNVPGSHSHGGNKTEDHGMAAGTEVGLGKNLIVNINDKVTFKWSGDSHDLQEMKGLKELTACNFNGSTSLSANGTNKTYTLPTGVAKTFYLSCSVVGHCGAKQMLIVNITAVKPTSPSSSAGSVMLPAFGLLAVLAAIGV